MQSATVQPRLDESVVDPGRFTVLIDGDCPLCKREAAWLQRRDRHSRLRFVDIAAEGFDPSSYDRTLEQLMGSIHGVTASGEIVTGVEVFRRAYGAIGLGWLLAPTTLPVLRRCTDFLYKCFARVRPMLQRKDTCQNGACRVR
ncbi:MAG: DUF393 domain-containing protein [Phycisphaera sp.]|nr:MAG: DUF393 domain-containing protein [Phycisphaera sp.]